MQHLILSSGAVLALSAPLCADFTQIGAQVLSHAVEYDASTQLVHFTLIYDVAPDYYTVDELGRQKDGFTFWVDSDPEQYYPGGSSDCTVTGSKIHTFGDIRVHDTWPPIPGGGGPFVGAVPYSLVETTVTFSVPFEYVGTSSGVFTYFVVSGVFGASNYFVANQSSTPIPAPAAWTWVIAQLGRGGSRRTRR